MSNKFVCSNYILLLLIVALITSCSSKKNKEHATLIPGSENMILIPMQAEDGKWGYVDESKKWIIDPQFYDARIFKKGMATAYTTKDESGIINTKAKWVIEPKYEVIQSLENGYFFAAYKDQPLVIIDENENIAVDGSIDESLGSFFTANLIPVLDNVESLIGYKNHKNEWIIKPQYIGYTPFIEGYAIVKQTDSLQAVIDTLGNTIYTLPRSLKTVSHYADGLIPVSFENKYGYIDLKGNQVIDFKFDYAFNFDSGLAVVFEDNICKIINTKGEIILSLPQYKDAYISSSDYIIVLSNEEVSHKGVIKKDGDVIVAPVYAKLVDQGNGYFRATEDSGKIYYIDTKGNKFIKQ